MSRLPVVNQDEDAWGTILNDFLLVSHNADGTLKPTVPLLAPTTDSRNQFVGDTPARLVIPIRVAADTQNRLQIGADGKLTWGPGGSTVPDANLYRRSAAALQTDSAFYVGSALVIDAQGGGSGNKLYFGSALDTNLYRSSATVVKSDGVIVAQQGLMSHQGDATQVWITVLPGGQGGIAFGSAGDANLYRASAGTLKTDGSIQAATEIFARPGAAQQVYMGNVGGNAGLGFLADTQLYRNLANQLTHYSGSFGTFNAGAFTVGSDRSLKSEIEQHDVPIDMLLKAGIYTYQLNKTEGRHLGLMSDELPDELVNMTVDPEGGDDLRFIDLYKLTTALLATVQHLNQRLEALER